MAGRGWRGFAQDAKRLGGRQMAVSRRYPAEIKKACEQNAREIIKKARQFGGRRYKSLSELAKMGHPYARRHEVARQKRQRLRTARQALRAQGRSTAHLVYPGGQPATPKLPAAPHIINRQSGKFQEGWRLRTWRRGDRITYDVENTVPYAKRLRGTKYMIERPVLEEAVARTDGLRRRNLERARERGLRAAKR